MLSTRDPPQNKGHIQTENEGLEKRYSTQIETKRKQEQQYSDKIGFKTKAVKRDKEGHYIMIKISIKKEDITIINIYAPNIGALQYGRQMLTSMKGDINNKQ